MKSLVDNHWEFHWEIVFILDRNTNDLLDVIDDDKLEHCKGLCGQKFDLSYSLQSEFYMGRVL